MKFRLFIAFLISSFSAFAQIVDDSTHQVYGPKTTSFILEDDVLNNREVYKNPDTTFQKFHLFDYNLQNNWGYQTLGNLGTATKLIDYQPVFDIGKQIGYSVFNVYGIDAKDIKYYNTKSPYTNMNYLQNSKNDSRIYFTQSQNINARWNVTLQVQRLTASKQYGFTAPVSRQERLVDNWAFAFSSNYTSKNKKYIVLAHYNHLYHKQTEQGGMAIDNGYFDLVNMNKDLSSFAQQLPVAYSLEKHNDLHFYQQYKLKNGFQLFDILDIQSRKNFFNQPSFKTSLLSEYPLLDTNKVENQKISKNFVINNVFGVKGFYKGFNYRAYLRNRFFWVNSNFRNVSQEIIGSGLNITNNHQTMVGGWLAYYFPDSLSKLITEAEFLPAQKSALRLNANFFTKNIKLDFLLTVTPPTFLQEYNYSNLIFWNNGNPSVNNLLQNYFYRNVDELKTVKNVVFGGSMFFKGKNWYISPNAKNTTIINYIYFDENAQAQQLDNTINYTQIGGEGYYNLKKWNFGFKGNYILNNNNQDILPMPKVSVNTTIAYSFVYAKTLPIVIGTEVYYKSAYYAPAYMPVTQQFFIQNTYKSWGMPIVDVFANAKLNRVTLGIKMAAVNIGNNNKILPVTYFQTPFYPSLQRSFNFFVNWPLFD